MLSRIALLLACFIATTTWAIEQLDVTIGHWQLGYDKSDKLSLENIDFDLTYTQQGLSMDISADAMIAPAPLNQLTALKLHCVEVQFQGQGITCSKGQLQFTQRELGQQKIDFAINVDQPRQHYDITLSGLTLAAAQISAKASLSGQQWQLDMTIGNPALTPLIALLSPYLSTAQADTLSNGQLAGQIAMSVTLKGHNQQIDQLALSTQLSGLDLSDKAGKFVTEGLKTDLTLQAKRQDKLWHWQSFISLTEGQAYAEPVFLDLLKTPMTANANGTWHQETNQLTLTSSMIKHKTVGQAELSMTLTAGVIEHLKIDIAKTALASVYQHWLQPFTVGTAIDDLTISGDAALIYQQQAEDYVIQLNLDQLSAQDALNRFEIEGVSGDLAWTTLEQTLPVNLTWKSAALYAIPIGASSLSAQSKSQGISLLKPWHVPVLDGELQIKDFALQTEFESNTTWSFEGVLTPISMTQLSALLGWPTLHGKLSGVIPKVAYKGQEIKVDGALTINLFEGTTLIHDLRLTEPFGAIPQVYSNIELLNFDLETMTETFDFGKMTGTLEGKIQNLRLANWQPVAFDAYLRTPNDDKVRHRISQQAVNNLSSLGGGASGALSRSALRFFKDFSYQRLGLSCKLRNDVCEMAGVEEAEQGYYMVKGGGFPPRINVVGYTRRVNWPELISRLKAVSTSSGPIVQ